MPQARLEKYPAYPQDLADVVLDWLGRDFFYLGAFPESYRFSREQLHQLVDGAFLASLQTEEGRPARLHLVLDTSARQATLRFARPLEYTPEHLVRLAPTIGLGARWLVAVTSAPSSADPRPAITLDGTCDPQLLDGEAPPARPWGNGLLLDAPRLDGLKLAVLGPGFLRLGSAPDHMELRGGRLRYSYSLLHIPAVAAWLAEVARPAGAARGPDAEAAHAVRKRIAARTWLRILQGACADRHGACFLVVPDGDAHAARLRLNFPARDAQLHRRLHDRLRVEPRLSRHERGRGDLGVAEIDRAPFLERDLARCADLVAALGAVDGAVVLRRNLDLVGFGAEILLAGGDDAEAVEFVTQPGQARPERRPLAHFGMRHRSAFRFCQAVPGALAFVVSQDGDLRVFCPGAAGVRLYEGASPDDYFEA